MNDHTTVGNATLNIMQRDRVLRAIHRGEEVGKPVQRQEKWAGGAEVSCHGSRQGLVKCQPKAAGVESSRASEGRSREWGQASSTVTQKESRHTEETIECITV